MWKKISEIDAFFGIHEGDIISQNPFTALLEFVIQSFEKESLSLLCAENNGKWTSLYFHRNYLFMDHWWLKRAFLPSS